MWIDEQNWTDDYIYHLQQCRILYIFGHDEDDNDYHHHHHDIYKKNFIWNMETNKTEWKSNLISFNTINLVKMFVCVSKWEYIEFILFAFRFRLLRFQCHFESKSKLCNEHEAQYHIYIFCHSIDSTPYISSMPHTLLRMPSYFVSTIIDYTYMIPMWHTYIEMFMAKCISIVSMLFVCVCVLPLTPFLYFEPYFYNWMIFLFIIFLFFVCVRMLWFFFLLMFSASSSSTLQSNAIRY